MVRIQCAKITELAVKNDIKVLTLYAFSTENWSRPQSEVSGLFLDFECFFKTGNFNIDG